MLQTNVTIFPSQCLRSRSVSSPPLSSHKKPVSSLNNYRPVAPHEVSRQETQSKHCTRTHYSLCTGLTDNAISFTLHKIPTHLENKDSYFRMLFIDCTIIPYKLYNLGLPSAPCNGKTLLQHHHNEHRRSSGLCTQPGAVHSFTHDCVATHPNNVLMKLADDTTVIGLITNNDETTYRTEVSELVTWCEAKNLTLNTSKAKEMVVDMRSRTN